MRRYVLFISALVALLGTTIMPSPASAQTAPRCFDAPGIVHCIEARFREYWEQNGGLAMFGYPLTAAQAARAA